VENLFSKMTRTMLLGIRVTTKQDLIERMIDTSRSSTLRQ
jgi:hypothetical protein